jgi:hypothetical protein
MKVQQRDLTTKKGMAVTPPLMRTKGKTQLATAGQSDCIPIRLNYNSTPTTFDLFTTLYRPLPDL